MALVCRTCGSVIACMDDYYTKYRCRRCYNIYQMDYHRLHDKDRRDGKMKAAGCDFDCFKCTLPDCALPVEAEDCDEKYIMRERWD
jgi:hypothetical protein